MVLFFFFLFFCLPSFSFLIGRVEKKESGKLNFQRRNNKNKKRNGVAEMGTDIAGHFFFAFSSTTHQLA
jgi:hypothetical protein